MSIAVGSRVGPYEVLGKLGEGGMGEVWRARDQRLSRDVAIKVLPAGFVADADRLARFEREAKLLASLNHPNIAQLYGLEEDPEGLRALVMELVEGPTLAERLEGGPLPLDESLAIARQLADALEEAHEKGIVHRDLKPLNIKIAPSGSVKVLDFGLAKALDPGGSGSAPASIANSPTLMHSPTLTLGGTELGVVLGTAAYMSPEQARGRLVDRRADIWAFGCVFWEMLTGRRLFGAETNSDMLAAVLRQEIVWSELPPETPPAVRRLLRRCLERDPRLRLRDIGEARVALDERTIEDTFTPPPAPVPPARRRALPWALVAVLSVAATLLAWRLLPSRSSVSGSARSPIVLSAQLPTGLRVDSETNVSQNGVIAIAPDGSRIVLVGETEQGQRLYVRELASPELRAIPGTEGATSPFFSPDGRWVGFFSRGKLRKVAVSGGEPVELADCGLDRGGAWAPDGTIVYSPDAATGLFRIRATGGAPEVVTRIDEARSERTHRWPTFLPGGREVAFTIGTLDKAGDYEDSEIGVVELETGRRRILVRGASMVRVTSSGHILLGRDGEVLAMPLADANGEVPSETVSVLSEVSGDPASGVVYFDVAANGTLTYVERDPGAKKHLLAWAGRDGKIELLPAPPLQYQIPRISPDGRRIAVGIGQGRGGDSDIWIYELDSAALNRLTFDGRSAAPVWSRDGSTVFYANNVSGGGSLQSKRMDGSEPPRVVAAFDSPRSRGPLDVAPDGTILYSEDYGIGFANDLLLWPPGGTEPRPFARTPAVEINGSFSPDGRYIVYSINSSGSADVFVEAYPRPGGRWQVAQAANASIRWSRDGSEIYVGTGEEMSVIPVRTFPTFSIGTAHPIFQTVFLPFADVHANFDVAADGRALIVRPSSEETRTDRFVVALDWFAELEKKVPLSSSRR